MGCPSRRAQGGPFGRGWLLTGEGGPELEYRTRGGYIAHNGQLRDMLAMSDTIRRNVARMRSVSATAPIASGAARPGAGARSTTIGDVNVYPSPGMDERPLAREIRAQSDRAAKRGDDALHDGGLYGA